MVSDIEDSMDFFIVDICFLKMKDISDFDKIEFAKILFKEGRENEGRILLSKVNQDLDKISKAAYMFLVVNPFLGGAASTSKSVVSMARSLPGSGQPCGTALYMNALF